MRISFLVNEITGGWSPTDKRLGGTVTMCYNCIMKKIQLSKGRHAIVDDDDYQELSKHKWYFDGRRYAKRDTWVNGKKGKSLFMHRVVAETPPNLFTDHINMNTLDNRKNNLRICTKSQNMHNRGPQSNNTSGYKNIYWAKDKQKWTVEIKLEGKKYHIGRWSSLNEAIKYRDMAHRGLVGDFSRAY